jgi:hypothetical protein
LRQPCHAVGYGLRAVSDAADATGWVSAIRHYRRLHDRAHGYRLDYCEIYRHPGLALVWLRKTLVGITVFIGLDDCPVFAAIADNVDAASAAVHLGMAMSTQFTAMNTITLADLTDENASSGNSLLAVTQQLSISLGVAVSAAVLRFYEGLTAQYRRAVSLHLYYHGRDHRIGADVYAVKSERWPQPDKGAQTLS